MKLVRSIADLQINNLCRNEECYCEPVFVPEDIKLQVRVPYQAATDYEVAVTVFDAELNETVPLVFDYLIGTDSEGERYINIVAKQLPAESCFYLKVVVTNEDFTVFSKYTERYCIKEADVQCVAVFQEAGYDIQLNGVEPAEPLPSEFLDGLYVVYLPNCTDVVTSSYDFELRKIIVPVISCGMAFKKVEAYYNCFDSISGEYYGDYIEKIAGNPLLKYTRSFWLPLRIDKAPSELKVNYINKQCRTTRSEITPLYDVKCLIPLPAWKAQEIEEMFLAKQLYINSELYAFTGGNVIEKDTISCSCSYIMKARVQQCTKQNSFSCNDICERFCSFYVINNGIKDQAYYSENGSYIGSLYTQLVAYLTALPGVVSVQDYSVTGLECYPVAVLKISHTGYLPAYIYAGSRFTVDKVYARRDDCVKPTKLCEGSSYCPPAIITVGVPYPEGCSAFNIILGTPYEQGTGESKPCLITAINDWVDDGSEVAKTPGGIVTLHVKVIKTHDNYINEPILQIGITDCGDFDPEDFDPDFFIDCGETCAPCQQLFIDLGEGNSFIIFPNGQVIFSGESDLSGVIEYSVTYNKNC